MELVIRNAKLGDKKELVDIGIKNGKIVEVRERIAEKGEMEIDAKGKLVAPSFVDPHIHLDKALTFGMGGENVIGTLEESIAIMQEIKSKYTIEDVKKRAIEVIKLAVSNGCTIIRANADVDPIGGLIPVKGLVKAKKECSGIADIQIVAFPQEGILQSEGTEELMWKAMELGADVVGGMPANEMIDEHSKKHIDIVFDIAKKFNADIDMHVDETKDPGSKTLQYYAVKAIEEGYQGRVTAGHCLSLAYQNDYYAAKVIGLVKKAKMNITSNPLVLICEGIDREPKTRGLTRVRDFLQAGVNVACGQDCVKDGFYLFGKADPLEVGLLMAHAAQLGTVNETKAIFDMITVNGAKALRLSDYGIEVGKKANLNVIDAPSMQEALRLQPVRSYVVKNGKVIAKNEKKSEISF